MASERKCREQLSRQQHRGKKERDQRTEACPEEGDVVLEGFAVDALWETKRDAGVNGAEGGNDREGPGAALAATCEKRRR